MQLRDVAKTLGHLDGKQGAFEVLVNFWKRTNAIIRGKDRQQRTPLGTYAKHVNVAKRFAKFIQIHTCLPTRDDQTLRNGPVGRNAVVQNFMRAFAQGAVAIALVIDDNRPRRVERALNWNRSRELLCIRRLNQQRLI